MTKNATATSIEKALHANLAVQSQVLARLEKLCRLKRLNRAKVRAIEEALLEVSMASRMGNVNVNISGNDSVNDSDSGEKDGNGGMSVNGISVPTLPPMDETTDESKSNNSTSKTKSKTKGKQKEPTRVKKAWMYDPDRKWNRRFFVDADKSIPKPNADTLRRREWEGHCGHSNANVKRYGTNTTNINLNGHLSHADGGTTDALESTVMPFFHPRGYSPTWSKTEIELLKRCTEKVRQQQQEEATAIRNNNDNNPPSEIVIVRDQDIDFQRVAELIRAELLPVDRAESRAKKNNSKSTPNVHTTINNNIHQNSTSNATANVIVNVNNTVNANVNVSINNNINGNANININNNIHANAKINNNINANADTNADIHIKNNIDAISIKNANANANKNVNKNANANINANNNIKLRTTAEYRTKFLNSLSPSIDHRPFTKQESLQILHLVKRANNQPRWDQIASTLHTRRTPFQCFRYYRTQLSNSAALDNHNPTSDTTYNDSNTTSNSTINDDKTITIWTKDQDRFLLKYIAACGPQHIICNRTASDISSRFFAPAGRFLSAKQIMMRVNMSLLNPKYVHDRWREDEERKLALAMRVYSDVPDLALNRVTAHFPNRANKSIAEKWNNSLNPEFSTQPFTAAEDKALLSAVQNAPAGPNDWKSIAKQFPSRRPESLFNRWSDLADHEDVIQKHLQTFVKLRAGVKRGVVGESGCTDTLLNTDDFVVRVKSKNMKNKKKRRVG